MRSDIDGNEFLFASNPNFSIDPGATLRPLLTLTLTLVVVLV